MRSDSRTRPTERPGRRDWPSGRTSSWTTARSTPTACPTASTASGTCKSVLPHVFFLMPCDCVAVHVVVAATSNPAPPRAPPTPARTPTTTTPTATTPETATRATRSTCRRSTWTRTVRTMAASTRITLGCVPFCLRILHPMLPRLFVFVVCLFVSCTSSCVCPLQHHHVDRCRCHIVVVVSCCDYSLSRFVGVLSDSSPVLISSYWYAVSHMPTHTHIHVAMHVMCA